MCYNSIVDHADCTGPARHSNHELWKSTICPSRENYTPIYGLRYHTHAACESVSTKKIELKAEVSF